MKALALGANSVAVGRAYLYGLAAGGTPGVRKAVATLAKELEISMGLLGVGSVDECATRSARTNRGRPTVCACPRLAVFCARVCRLRARGPELVRARRDERKRD
jgi:hypothetical protein